MELEQSEGQVESAPGDGQAESTSESGVEQSVAPSQTTSDGPDAGGVEEFFDPKDVIGTPNEAGYKQMQGEFTKRMQGISEQQTKIDAYDAFMRNPQAAAQQLAQQYGLNIVQADPNKPGEDWSPKTWDEVMDRATAQARDEVRQEFEPLTNEVRDLKRQNVETYFDSNHPDWRTYESSMVENLSRYPQMANDPDTLYRVSVPPEILEARATKAALKKLKGEGESAAVSGNKTTSVPTTTKPGSPISIDDAFKLAKAELGTRGLTAPPE